MYHQVATMGSLGSMTPTMIQEVAPGDTWSGKVGMLLRLSPLNHALLQDIQVDQFSFYVPHRLVYADWEDFIAAGPDETPTYILPSVSIPAGSVQGQCLFWASHSAEAKTYNALRLYALNLIWNEYFRDEQETAIAPTVLPTATGIAVSFKKDYWSTLRDAQGLDQAEFFVDSDLGTGVQTSAQDILGAIARQKIATKRATYGTRYIDILRSYGINVNYQMLQRPELVAMSRGTVNVTDVVATDGANLGDLAGHGITGNRLSLKRKTFPEHGVLMNLVVARPVMSNEFLTEWFDRASRVYADYYDPGLVPLPPVEVIKRDVMGSIDNIQSADSLGFQPWGDWYRKAMNRNHVGLADWIGNVAFNQTDITADDLRQITPGIYSTLFSDTTFGDFQVSCVNKVKALRFIPRQNQSTVTGMGG